MASVFANLGCSVGLQGFANVLGFVRLESLKLFISFLQFLVSTLKLEDSFKQLLVSTLQMHLS